MRLVLSTLSQQADPWPLWPRSHHFHGDFQLVGEILATPRISRRVLFQSAEWAGSEVRPGAEIKASRSDIANASAQELQGVNGYSDFKTWTHLCLPDISCHLLVHANVNLVNE